MPEFIPGRQLSEILYREAVLPILADVFPGCVYGAGRLDSGSDVLGYDDPMSTDHDWGARLQLFLHEADYAQHADALIETLRQRLPHTLRGWPVGFTAPDPNDNGTQSLDFEAAGPVNHRVTVWTLSRFFQRYLGHTLQTALTPADWLAFPAQKLCTIAQGPVFADGVGLAAVRARMAWYPHDVWLLLMAAGWQRISQEEHLMPRAGYAGDALGSALIGARLVRDIMQLAFLIERQYAPYPKWFGRAFSDLSCAAGLRPALEGALQTPDWQAREAHLCAAYEVLASLHNGLDVTPALPVTVRPFFDRPFRVIGGERFARALLEQITDPAVLALVDQPLVGSVDQFSDSTDLRSDPVWHDRLRRFLTP